MPISSALKTALYEYGLSALFFLFVVQLVSNVTPSNSDRSRKKVGDCFIVSKVRLLIQGDNVPFIGISSIWVE